MSFKNLFKLSSRDTAYDHRKVLNSEDMIKIASLMGHTYAEIGTVCGFSKTMISHWGSHNRPEKTTYAQLEPMFERYGRGRFQCELEALPEGAIEYRKYNEVLFHLMLAVPCILVILFVAIKPCSDNWSECKELPWYRMAAFDAIKLKEDLKEFKEWREMSTDSVE
ncbi:MAG: hypothetical protein V7765_04110 [Oleispira sp.]